MTDGATSPCGCGSLSCDNPENTGNTNTATVVNCEDIGTNGEDFLANICNGVSGCQIDEAKWNCLTV